MKKLFSCADAYIKTMTITEMGQLKLCLGSIGVLIGLSVKKEHRKTVAVGAATINGCNLFAADEPLCERHV